MRKYTSVAALYIRSSLYRVIFVILLMAAGEGLVFCLSLHRILQQAEAGSGTWFAPYPEAAVAGSVLKGVATAGFIIVFNVLMLTCSDLGRTKYTLRRLRVSERAVFWIHAITSICCFFIFWAAQAALLYLFAEIYVAQPSLPHTEQTVMLMFYRDGFCHGMAPLADVSVFIRNLLLLAGLGVTTACFQPLQRQSRIIWEPYTIMSMTITGFVALPADIIMWWLIMAIALVDAEMMVRIRSKEAKEHER